MKWIVWLCASALLGCGRGSADPPPSAAGAVPEKSAVLERARPAGPKVVFLGDSISAGLHLPAEQAFPVRLHANLAARGQAFELVNAGVSGDTTAGGLRRIDWLLKQAPAIVVVELGGNDGMRGQPIASIEQNLRAILERVKASGAKPLLLGMRIPDSYGPSYAAEFAGLYAKLADELGVAFVPFFMEGVAGEASQNLPDGIHPTAEGHEKLAKALSEPLSKLLATVQAGPTTEH